jgi:hypothetical protein
MAVALACVAAVVGVARPAAAEDPLFIEWSGYLGSLTDTYTPNSDNDCTAGRIQCVDAVIREMTKRFDPLAQACSHDAVFALTYLRTTEEYRRSVADGTFFVDTNFVNHQDAVFARYYFDAFDDWHAGRTTAVPQAWRIAFDAADRQLVTGTGNLLLGMSAHVNRDLPYVLAAIGLVRPDGTSRKDDHDKVNQFLNRVLEPLIAEASARFDDTIDDAMIDGTTLDATALLQILVGWREEAWRNAERLVNATTDAERAQVAASIESAAATEAQLLVAQTAYGPLDGLAGRRAARNTYCAAHWAG